MSATRLEYLKTQLKHPLPTIRYNAVRALGEMQTDDVVADYLRDVAENDTSEGVREAAATVLEELGYTVPSST